MQNLRLFTENATGVASGKSDMLCSCVMLTLSDFYVTQGFEDSPIVYLATLISIVPAERLFSCVGNGSILSLG
jgi:hypothetical protein